MKKNGLLNPLRYICLIFIFSLGLMSIVGSGAEDDFYMSPCFPFPESWCTPAPPETIPPEVTYNYPRDQESWIPLTTTIRVEFSEAMYCASLTSSTFYITDDLGNPVEGTITFEEGLTWGPLKAVFTPYSELDPNAIYNATVTKGVMDAARNNLEYDFSWSFTTGPEGIGTWKATSLINAPPEKNIYYTAAWTGTEMILYSGYSGTRYDPIADIWYPISSVDAPEKRHGHTAIWTGSEMIVWGGEAADSSYNYLNTGARYDPITDIWYPISVVNAPEGRSGHTAIWTGSEMIVCAGRNGGYFPTLLNSCGSYNPVTDTWQNITSVGAPMERSRYTAVWTSTEMILYSGDTGARYDPITDIWYPISMVDAPEKRGSHTAIWTGSEMIIWGGSNGDNYFNTGGRYDPSTDTWQTTSTINAILGRRGHTAIWTGTEMIVWGGQKGSWYPRLNFYGGRYNPNLDSWTATSTTNAPEGRFNHIAVWTGTEMIVWGGSSDNNGGVYTP